jgi:hypothetical protein
MLSSAEYPLERAWAVWEMWNTSDTSNYRSNMAVVGCFGTMWDFLQHWENLPHSTPNFFFSNYKENTERRIEGLQAPIEAVGLFENGVCPAWEDQINAKGSDFSFRKQMDEHLIKDIWKKLVFSLVGETIPQSEEVVGVRIVDKNKNFKCEIWVRFNTEEFPEKAAEIRNWMAVQFLLGPTDILTSLHETKSKKA